MTMKSYIFSDFQLHILDYFTSILYNFVKSTRFLYIGRFSMNNQIAVKEYKSSDCLLANACKEFFHGKTHNKICDAFIDFICKQANGKGMYAEKIKDALNKELLILGRLFMMDKWNNLFRYIYSNMGLCLSLANKVNSDYSAEMCLMWHDFVYEKA